MSLDQLDVLLPDQWTSNARFHANKVAAICGDRRETWSELDAGFNRVANRLRACAIGRGDRVAVVLSNSLDALHILFGVVKAGACVVPISTMLRPEQIALLIVDSGAVALFVGAGLRNATNELLATPPGALEPMRISVGFESPGWHSYASWVRGAVAAPPLIRHEADDPFNIIYSSGTTGSPKGIVHTHRARLHWSYSNALELQFDRRSVALATTSLYSNGTWFMVLPPLFMGATMMVLEQFSVPAFLSAVAAERVTHTFMVPTQFETVLASAELRGANLSSLRVMLSAGSALREKTKAEIREKMGPGLFELYGFSEGFASIIGPDCMFEKPGSVGKPILGFDVEILNDDGSPVPVGSAGEIAGCGAGLMKEYYAKPEATQEVLWRDARGRTFVRGGDIGRIDADGFLYILDRKKDMILSGGFNVFPKDIEAIAAQHPAVADVAVIGIPHAKWGETPLALVIPKQGMTPDLAEVRNWCNARLGKTQQIHAVELREQFPRNALGKVIKRWMREPYWPREG